MFDEAIVIVGGDRSNRYFSSPTACTGKAARAAAVTVQAVIAAIKCLIL